jgi:uncharacterized protein HemX
MDEIKEQLTKEEAQVAKDAIGDAIGEAIKSQKGSLPPWLLAIGIIVSVAGSYFKSQSNLEYLQREVNCNSVKIEQIEDKVEGQQNNFIRLDERLAGLQRELSEIKLLLKDFMHTRTVARVD